MDTGNNHKTEVKREETVAWKYLSVQRFRKQNAKTDTLLSNIQLVKKKSLIWIKSFSAWQFPSGKSQIHIQPYLNIHLITNKITTTNRPLMPLLTMSHSTARIRGCHLFSFQATWLHLLRCSTTIWTYTKPEQWHHHLDHDLSEFWKEETFQIQLVNHKGFSVFIKQAHISLRGTRWDYNMYILHIDCFPQKKLSGHHK